MPDAFFVAVNIAGFNPTAVGQPGVKQTGSAGFNLAGFSLDSTEPGIGTTTSSGFRAGSGGGNASAPGPNGFHAMLSAAGEQESSIQTPEASPTVLAANKDRTKERTPAALLDTLAIAGQTTAPSSQISAAAPSILFAPATFMAVAFPQAGFPDASLLRPSPDYRSAPLDGYGHGNALSALLADTLSGNTGGATILAISGDDSALRAPIAFALHLTSESAGLPVIGPMSAGDTRDLTNSLATTSTLPGRVAIPDATARPSSGDGKPFSGATGSTSTLADAPFPASAMPDSILTASVLPGSVLPCSASAPSAQSDSPTFGSRPLENPASAVALDLPVALSESLGTRGSSWAGFGQQRTGTNDSRDDTREVGVRSLPASRTSGGQSRVATAPDSVPAMKESNAAGSRNDPAFERGTEEVSTSTRAENLAPAGSVIPSSVSDKDIAAPVKGGSDRTLTMQTGAAERITPGENRVESAAQLSEQNPSVKFQEQAARETGPTGVARPDEKDSRASANTREAGDVPGSPAGTLQPLLAPLAPREMPSRPNETVAAPKEVSLEPPTANIARPGLAREISLKLGGGDVPNIAVQLSERAGKIDVAVRTGDTQLGKSLQSGLGDLVTQLENRGFKAEAFTPGLVRNALFTHSSSESSANQQQPGHSGSWGSNRERQGDSNSRRQPRSQGQFGDTLAEETQGRNNNDTQPDE